MFGKKRNLSEDAENTQTPYDSDSLGYEDGGMDYPEEEYAEDSVGRDTEETDGYDEYGENEGGDSADGEYYGEYYDEDDEYGDEDLRGDSPKVGRTDCGIYADRASGFRRIGGGHVVCGG